SEAAAEVWSANQLIGFLKCFPSLALAINGLDRLHFQTHQSWSKNWDMGGGFEIGEPQQIAVQQLRDTLRVADSPVHLRMSGDPGIGKTRLLLEATSCEDLVPVVLYCESPQHLRESGLVHSLLREDNLYHAILIVDEC